MNIEDIISGDKKEKEEKPANVSENQLNIYKFCPSCGFNNEKLFKFCPGCGSALLAD